MCNQHINRTITDCNVYKKNIVCFFAFDQTEGIAKFNLYMITHGCLTQPENLTIQGLFVCYCFDIKIASCVNNVCMKRTTCLHIWATCGCDFLVQGKTDNTVVYYQGMNSPVSL
mgnify:CR=1 FL=1